MNWYYAIEGKQVGPVDDAQFEELSRTGTILPDTLVWHEGMESWQPYGMVRPPPPPGGEPLPNGPGPVIIARPEAVCAECGRMFPISETIQHSGVRICASCKPVFMQKLAEGAKLNLGRFQYAGFWIRFGAVFIDGLLLGAVNLAIGFVAGAGAGAAFGGSNEVLMGTQIVLFVINMSIAIAYETFMIGKYGATLGKKACKIHVITADGGQVSYGRAFGRYFAKALSYLLCLMGYIIAAFDDEKRALHDRICNTRVVMD